MHHDPPISRRRLMKTLFCSSVAMNLNLTNNAIAQDAGSVTKKSVLDLLAIGDFGSGDERQKAVSRSMIRYAEALGKKTDGLLLLGDNFYGPMEGGFKSPRWKTGYSDMYPAASFPGPCYAVLGNHDYHDTEGNEKIQLGYAASLTRKTRWTMPGKFYRVDLPAENPQITFLMIDTNWASTNRNLHEEQRIYWMTQEERIAQTEWLSKQLESKRAPFTVVVGHHPVFSEGKHGDTTALVEDLAPLLERHEVHVYISGHDHDLQHLELENLKTSFVVSGGGGARIYEQKPQLRKGSNVHDVHGFSHLSIVDGRLHIRNIDANGKIVHAFSKGAKHDWEVES